MSFNPDYFYTLGYKAQALFEYYNHSAVPLSADVSIPFDEPAYSAGLMSDSNDVYAKMVKADFPDAKVYVEFDNGDPISDPAVYLLACNSLDVMVEKFAGYLNIPVPTLPDLSKFTPVYVGMRSPADKILRIIVRSSVLSDVSEWCVANGLSVANLVDTGPNSVYEISFDFVDGRITRPTFLYAVNSSGYPVVSNAWYQEVIAHAKSKIEENYEGSVIVKMEPLVKVSLSSDLPDDYLKVYFMVIPRIY